VCKFDTKAYYVADCFNIGQIVIIICRVYRFSAIYNAESLKNTWLYEHKNDVTSGHSNYINTQKSFTFRKRPFCLMTKE